MKRLIVAVMLAGLGFGAAQAGNSRVKVIYEGETHVFTRLDLETLSVCSFKRQLADKFDLKMLKFDLNRGSAKLNEDKTMKGAYVNNSTTLTIIKKSGSNQCT